MTIRVSKPEFNLREKISELDYSRVPYEKMPGGSVVQVVFNSVYGQAINTTSASFQDSGLFVDIRPRFTSSKIIVTATIDAQTGNAAGKGVEYTFFRNIDGDATSSSPSVNLLENASNKNYISYSSAAGYIHERAIMMAEDNPNTIKRVQYRVFFHSHAGASSGIHRDWGGIMIKAEEIKQ
tara:strand:+ start:473 stop:1015 length:543 start_codon:yes stop_codon:yes gene_type:complete